MSTNIGAEAPLVAVAGISKRYGAIRALRDVSLAVERGRVVALCGHNGAGKSTLVKSLVGLVRPDQGQILVHGNPVHLRGPQDAQAHRIALVDQELSVVPVLSVAENLFLGNLGQPLIRRPRANHAAAAALLERVGLGHIAPGTPVERLRMGERQLVEIARLLGRDANLLILDEPTASLSDIEIRHVFAAIRAAVAQGRSVIYVSHRLDEIFEVCDEVVVMRDGAVVATAAVSELDRSRLIELMLGEAGQELRPLEEERASGPGLTVTGLTVPGNVRDFNLRASAGQIVGLAGQVGSGTSEVLRAIAGLVPDATGEVVTARRLRLGSPTRAARAGIVYISNDRQREGLFLGQPTGANLTATRLRSLSRLGVLRAGRASATERHLAELVGVERRRLGSAVAELSGGNQQKVFIGRGLDRASTAVLLLDDPTRGVDVGGRAEIHRLIRHAAAGALVIFSSTELDELLELSDVIVTMFRGAIVSTQPRAQLGPADVLAGMTHARPAPA